MMELNYNPYIIFASSTTPAGLYARKKWLNQELTPQWKANFQRCVEALLAHQSSDGSWQGSVIETIRHLFGLHLTIREANHDINTALDWLIQKALDAEIGRTIEGESLSSENLRSLPFTPGNFELFLVSATLFLGSIFERDLDPDILAIYEWRVRRILGEKDPSAEWPSANNILRAFVVHLVYSLSTATEMLVMKLSKAQEESGKWKKGIPLYKTVNALAHLDSEEAGVQVRKAFEYLVGTQNKDGTWGREEREWNTFLVVHAMKKKGVLE
jgi:hypothetical protein